LVRSESLRINRRRCGNADIKLHFSDNYPIRTGALKDFAHKAKNEIQAAWNTSPIPADNMKRTINEQDACKVSIFLPPVGILQKKTFGIQVLDDF